MNIKDWAGCTYDRQAKSITVSELSRNASPAVPFLPLFAPTVAKPLNEPYERSSYLMPGVEVLETV
jgi:hypothetical protein